MKKLALSTIILLAFCAVSSASIIRQDDKTKKHVAPAPKNAVPEQKPGKPPLSTMDTGKAPKKSPAPIMDKKGE